MRGLQVETEKVGREEVADKTKKFILALILIIGLGSLPLRVLGQENDCDDLGMAIILINKEIKEAGDKLLRCMGRYNANVCVVYNFELEVWTAVEQKFLEIETELKCLQSPEPMSFTSE